MMVKLPKEKTMTKVAKVAVIGAGPAGMFAAQRLHTAGIDVVVFEAGEKEQK